MRSVYAIYKGDTFVDLGTAKELAARTGLTPKTIQFMSTPSHLKKIKNKEGCLLSIKIGKEGDDLE